MTRKEWGDFCLMCVPIRYGVGAFRACLGLWREPTTEDKMEPAGSAVCERCGAEYTALKSPSNHDFHWIAQCQNGHFASLRNATVSGIMDRWQAMIAAKVSE